jgi:hypothetical protein
MGVLWALDVFNSLDASVLSWGSALTQHHPLEQAGSVGFNILNTRFD